MARMSSYIPDLPPCFTSTPEDKTIALVPVRPKAIDVWREKQSPSLQALCAETGFGAEDQQTLIERNDAGTVQTIYFIKSGEPDRYEAAKLAEYMQGTFGQTALGRLVFALETADLHLDEIFQFCLGWALAHYSFDTYIENPDQKTARLQWPEHIKAAEIEAYAQAIFLTRNLVNTPTNDMGPAEMETAAREIAGHFKARIDVIADDDLHESGFPLIHTVGDASDHRPRLIDITWGDPAKPLVTLVGKGVAFDSGGLNLKPGKAMAIMKKDMGGAAHVLGLGWLIMALNLPVSLRILVPAVENSISGAAFRPGDIMRSRLGLSVENTNTDAEGRLILADSLCYATEDKMALPDILIDYATLTGSARAALGHDIPAMCATNNKTAQDLQDISFTYKDPVWRMPLYEPYKTHLQSPVADLVNSASPPGDLIYSALFLQHFIHDHPDWVHLDCFAWESSGKPGRPQGGADTGLIAVFEYLKSRYV